MADIDVVPRRKTSAWIWVILAIIVLAILWWAFAGSRGNATSERLVTPAPPVASVVPASALVGV